MINVLFPLNFKASRKHAHLTCLPRKHGLWPFLVLMARDLKSNLQARKSRLLISQVNPPFI